MDLEQILGEILYVKMLSIDEISSLREDPEAFDPEIFIGGSDLYFDAFEKIQEHLIQPSAERQVIDEDLFCEMSRICDVCGNAFLMFWRMALLPALRGGVAIGDDESTRKASIESVVGVFYTIRWFAMNVMPRMVVHVLSQEAAACIVLMRIVLSLYEGDDATLASIREQFDGGESFSVDINGHTIFIQ